MKHDSKVLLGLLIWVIIFIPFCHCNQGDPPPPPVCDYSHPVQLQNYVWDIQVDGESLKDNPAFNFPYTTFNTAALEADLNTWLDNDGIVAVTMTNPEREFMIAIEQTGKVFEVVVFAGDPNGGNIIEVNFIQSC